MVSITPGSSKSRRRPLALRLASWLTAMWCVLAAGSAWADAEFVVRRAQTHVVDHVYQLDATIRYRFSQRALDALDNGVPLTIRLDIEVERERRYWFDEEVASLEQRYQLLYHALSAQYIIRNLNSGASDAYPSLPGALTALGTIDGFPLLDENLLDPHEHYRVALKASLDIESLPLPLRPLAYLTPAWWLGSDWFTWSLKR